MQELISELCIIKVASYPTASGKCCACLSLFNLVELTMLVMCKMWYHVAMKHCNAVARLVFIACDNMNVQVLLLILPVAT
jgi:hypothetical protein